MKIILTFLLINLLSVQPLMAWGSTGHRIVGKVAETYLTGNAKMQIKKILGHTDLSELVPGLMKSNQIRIGNMLMIGTGVQFLMERSTRRGNTQEMP
tara:strand:+ start:322 stop:612 length:291 start_codon:yes stop_codon:yes gene_type:complete